MAKNVLASSTNTSHSSRVTFRVLFAELSFRSTYGKLGCKIRGCVVLSDNLKGSARRSSPMIWSGAMAACITGVSALFSASVQITLCKLLSETGNETRRFVCSSIANLVSPYKNVRCICFFLSLWKYTQWWCWVAMNSSTAKWLWGLCSSLCNYLHAFCLPVCSLSLGLKSLL